MWSNVEKIKYTFCEICLQKTNIQIDKPPNVCRWKQHPNLLVKVSLKKAKSTCVTHTLHKYFVITFLCFFFRYIINPFIWKLFLWLSVFKSSTPSSFPMSPLCDHDEAFFYDISPKERLCVTSCHHSSRAKGVAILTLKVIWMSFQQSIRWLSADRSWESLQENNWELRTPRIQPNSSIV